MSGKPLRVSLTLQRAQSWAAYGIQRADSSMEYGVSISLGYTHVMRSDQAENIKLFLEA